jgi:hypothetical protein
MAGSGRTFSFILPMVLSPNTIESSSFTPIDAADNKIKLSLNTHDTEHWLSQANNIFSHLGISSNYEDYGETFASFVPY